MTDYAIRVERLCKEYVIGARERGSHKNFREAITDAVGAPWRRLLAIGHKPPPEERFWPLKDVSFDVKRGEVIGVIGRNGAGKSTLLKILARITAPTTGRVQIRGRAASLLEVGTGFHPELTGRENIYLNGAILGMSRAEVKRKFDGIVAFAEVEKFLDTPVKRYSSGMYVRLAFAVAAHIEPEIMLVDEVLAVGDVTFQKRCIGRMGDAARGGRTIMFVSHNLEAIGALCPRTIYFDNGRIRCMGTTSDIISAYLSHMRERDVGSLRSGESLQEFRLAGCGNQVMFHGLTLKTDNQKNIRSGDPISYSLCVRSSIDAGDLSIGHSVFDAWGSCIGTLITDETFSISAGDTLNLTLVVPDLCLAPGRYYAGFSIGRGGKGSNRQDLDIVVGQPWFEVIALGQDITSHWHRSWGNIVIKGAELRIASHGTNQLIDHGQFVLEQSASQSRRA